MFSVPPPEETYEEAAKHKVLRAYFLTSLDWILAALTLGFPVALGIDVYDSFEEVGSNGMVPYPGAKEKFQGGHAICVWGHDSERGLFLCRNSWGTDWGDGGNFYLPFSFYTGGARGVLASEPVTLHQTSDPTG
jgi:C1A family cysteine protease